MSNRYLVVNNVCKKTNIRDICLTSLASGFSIIYVGVLDIENLGKAVQSCIESGLSFQKFESLDECKEFLDSHQIPLVGIEIMDTALSVSTNPFSENIAFMPGNEVLNQFIMFEIKSSYRAVGLAQNKKVYAIILFTYLSMEMERHH